MYGIASRSSQPAARHPPTTYLSSSHPDDSPAQIPELSSKSFERYICDVNHFPVDPGRQARFPPTQSRHFSITPVQTKLPGIAYSSEPNRGETNRGKWVRRVHMDLHLPLVSVQPFRFKNSLGTLSKAEALIELRSCARFK